MTNHVFAPDRVFHFRKYAFANDALLAICRGRRAPSEYLSVAELLDRFPGSARIVPVAPADTLPAFRFEYHGSKPALHGGFLSESPLPPTMVLVIPSGRVVGRSGTVHVPTADACLREFEAPSRDATGFRREIRGGLGNPRFWKRTLLGFCRRQVVPALRRCPGRVAVLNALGSHNFFHWMSEILPRLWTLLRSGEGADWYVIDAHTRWQQESLNALGVPAEKVIPPHATLHLEADELLVPSLFPVQSIRPMAEHLAAALGVVKDAPRHGKIFVERRYSRKPRNADAFTALRRRHGFEDHRLENLPLASQVALFRNARTVLAIHGAGLTHLMHCRSGTHVIEIMPEGVKRLCYPRLSRIGGLRHVLIDAPRRGWHQDVEVPLDLLDRTLSTAASSGA